MNKVPINSTIRQIIKDRAKKIAQTKGLTLSAYIDQALEEAIRRDSNYEVIS